MVQKHDNRVRVSFFCHPEPGPEASSGSKNFGISVLGFMNLGFRAPSLYAKLLSGKNPNIKDFRGNL